MKIAIGMSGGLDSTYAAYLMKSEGHTVEGVSLFMHEHTDVSAAKESAEAVGIPLHIIDCREAFKEYVIESFADSYFSGQTPNPCIICNRQVKIASLCRFAAENGFDAVATGHYSSVLYENGRYFVRRASDETKDQSYVLWQLSQEQLGMLFLPLAGMKKADVRRYAASLGLKAAGAPESQEICFIPDNDYASYIERLRNVKFPEGNFVDENGNVVGRHKGIIHYTVGQRKGLGLALGQPVFVTKIDVKTNTVHVAPAGGEFSGSMTVGKLNFQKLPPRPGILRAQVKIRYAAKPVMASVSIQQDTDQAVVTFDKPARAVTPGQSAVFYDGGDLLFGGIIN